MRPCAASKGLVGRSVGLSAAQNCRLRRLFCLTPLMPSHIPFHSDLVFHSFKSFNYLFIQNICLLILNLNQRGEDIGLVYQLFIGIVYQYLFLEDLNTYLKCTALDARLWVWSLVFAVGELLWHQVVVSIPDRIVCQAYVNLVSIVFIIAKKGKSITTQGKCKTHRLIF